MRFERTGSTHPSVGFLLSAAEILLEFRPVYSPTITAVPSRRGSTICARGGPICRPSSKSLASQQLPLAGTGHPSIKGAARGWRWHRFAIPHRCASVDELLKHEDLFDAAIVAISVEPNSEAATRFIIGGNPRLFAKPLAMSVARATGLRATTGTAVAYAVGHNRRFYSSVRAAADYCPRAPPHDVFRRPRSGGNRSSRDETSRQSAS